MARRVFLSVSLVLSISPQTKIEAATKDINTNVESIAGMLTNLPCNITPPYSNDHVNLVLWYKDGYGKPLYSFDLRNHNDNSSGSSVGVTSSSGGSSKAQFYPRSVPTAVLSLFGISLNDSGIYNCRVDFKRSPTRHWKVNLTIIEPPKSSSILDKAGLVLQQYVRATENKSLILTCDIFGGWPNSHVFWLHRGDIVDETYVELEGIKSRNTMELRDLRREDNGTDIVCVGNNNNMTLPVTKSVKLLLNMLPLAVHIPTPGAQVAGIAQNVTCVSEGAEPTPRIRWSLSTGRILKEAESQRDGDEAFSILHFVSSPRDDGKDLICEVIPTWTTDEEQTTNMTYKASVKLNVQYAPQVTLTLGKALEKDKIVEGDDIYFDCEVTANPEATNIRWFKDDVEVITDRQAGINVNQKSLIIYNITRHFSGSLVCQAENRVGQGSSAELRVNVKYAPVCVRAASVQTDKAAALRKEHKVLCEVDANPPPIFFAWQYNTTSHSEFLSNESVIMEKYVSVATVTTDVPNVHGSLLCWGKNAVGYQSMPCVHTFSPAGKPEPVKNCHVSKRSYNSILVECTPGKDNGLQQTFHIEIYPQTKQGEKTKAAAERTNKHFPFFQLDHLEDGTKMKFVIYSVNQKGKSKPVTLEGSTLVLDRKDHAKNLWVNETFQLKKLVLLLVYLAVALLFLGGLSYFARSPLSNMFRRKGSLWNHERPKDEDDFNNPPPIQLLQPDQLQESDTNITRF